MYLFSLKIFVHSNSCLKFVKLCKARTKLNIGKGTEEIRTSFYDKREDFNFKVVNFPYLDSKTPKNPAYGIYISQLVRYARICSDKIGRAHV